MCLGSVSCPIIVFVAFSLDDCKVCMHGHQLSCVPGFCKLSHNCVCCFFVGQLQSVHAWTSVVSDIISL